MAADKAHSKAHSKSARARLTAAAARKPAITAAVALASAAGLAATAISLSASATTHASGRTSAPTATTRPVTTARAARTVAPRRSSTAQPSSLPATSHPAAPAKPKAAKPTPAKTKANLDASDHNSSAKKTVSYTVQAGDSLSSISAKVYGNSSDWPVLYYANKSGITSADDISAGQALSVPPLPATIPAAPVTENTSPSTSTSTSASSGASQSTSSSSAGQSDATVSASDYSGFQACVISRESGGNSQVMNASGHYGLYQFSESTWVAYGGSAADFGHASVAEQNQVFANAMAAGGESNWAPYDGC